MMTAAHESGLGRYTKQIKGPALGLYQMEPLTLLGSYEHYINYRPELQIKIHQISGVSRPDRGQLQFNPVYSSIMARLKYYRAPGALPSASNIWALAEYAKKHFNTYKGKATPADYHDAYRTLVLV